MEWIASPEAWVALATLAVLEIVLGIDNIIFISILADKLPEDQQPRARRNGLILAMATRLALLGTITFIMKLTEPLFTLLGHGFSGRDLILLVGGSSCSRRRRGKSTTGLRARKRGRRRPGPSATAPFWHRSRSWI